MYAIKTLQYGEFEEVVKHNDIDALKHDLCNMVKMRSFEIIEIYEKGIPMSEVRKKILFSQARRDS